MQEGTSEKANICAICHRGLKDPKSIDRGMGPVCAGKEKSRLDEEKDKKQEMMPIGPRLPDEIVCKRKNGEACVNIPHWLIYHSPTGFEWGYSGSGPADLALNIVAALIGENVARERGIYQEFKRKFISEMPREGGTIYKADVITWLKGHGYQILEGK
jgi:hypothetical protein